MRPISAIGAVLGLVSNVACDFPDYNTAQAVDAGGAGGKPDASLGGTQATAGQAGHAGAGGRGGAAGAGGAGPPPLPLDCEGELMDCTCQDLDGRSYAFCTAVKAWDVARITCQDANGRLAVLSNPDDNARVALALGSLTLGLAFVGGRQSTIDQTWRWLDGTAFYSQGEPIPGQFEAFQPSEPSGNGDCLLLTAAGNWDDVSCGSTYAFVCQGLD